MFIARWDLDKTYLRTEFDTLGDLLRTAVERPDQKRSVPGAAALLRELGRSGARIHILSGSPRQMRSRLEEKLRIDGARWDEMTLKPNLRNLMRLRFFALRDQLGYKLPSLLAARVRDQARAAGAPCHEALLGDDAEADAFVYSLYADVVAGAVDAAQLAHILDAGKVYDDQAKSSLAAASALERAPAVERILIHLDRQSPPSHFDAYGPRVVPFFNYLQAAFVLAEDGRIDAPAVLRVAAELVTRHRFDDDALARSWLDLYRRGHLAVGGAQAFAAASTIEDAAVQPSARSVLARMAATIAGYAADPPERAVRRAASLDYVGLATKHRGGSERRRRA